MNFSKWQASSWISKSTCIWGRARTLQQGDFIFISLIDGVLICSKNFPLFGSIANCQPDVLSGSTCRTASFFLQWQDWSCSCRIFIGLIRGGSQLRKAGCIPKCPSQATSVTGLEGGKTSRGFWIFIMCIAGSPSWRGSPRMGNALPRHTLQEHEANNLEKNVPARRSPLHQNAQDAELQLLDFARRRR